MRSTSLRSTCRMPLNTVKKITHRHQDEGQRHLGGEVDAEPDHEQRRQHHARNGVEHSHHRLEQLGDWPQQCGDDAEHECPAQDAERQAERARR